VRRFIDPKFGGAETAGAARMIDGLAARYTDDEERLNHGSALFEALHAALSAPRTA
jgi:hypothetical protein